MKAIIFTAYGPPEVLRPAEVDKPTPGPNDILIRNYATSVGYGDLVTRDFGNLSPREFHMPLLFWLIGRLTAGFNTPKTRVLGSEFAGTIESVGGDVSRFKEGDHVFGYLGQTMGAYAEYIRMPEAGVVTGKPVNMTFEEAAVIPYGAIMALHLLREKGNIRPGHKVLVNGASGSIGSAAVQIAKSYGAEVTGVCGTPRLGFVKTLGADNVIDYAKEDFTTNGQTYDLIFDVLGKSSFARCKGSLAQNGRYLLASFKMRDLVDMLRTAIGRGKKVICAIAPGSVEDLVAVKELVEAGHIKAAIDKRFPLEEAAEAHRYVEQGRKKGHIALVVRPDS